MDLDFRLLMDQYSLEFMFESDRYFNLLQTVLEDPNQRNSRGDTLLHIAAASTKGNSDVVQLLIDRGADVNSTTPFEETPLHFAVCSRNHAAIGILSKAGASINSADYLQRTALHFAIDGREGTHASLSDAYVEYDFCIVKWLFRHPDIDLNPVDFRGETPLMWAVRRRQSTVVSALLEKGADPNIPNYINQTPLHEALSGQKTHHDIVFKLLAKGANIYAADILGETPVDILLSNICNDETYLFAVKCVKLIAFRYRIRESLERQLEKFPLLSEHLKRCSEEIRLMRKHVIYDNVTVHDFACGCFQSQDPMEEIYDPVVAILFSGSYIEYRNLILCAMSKRDLRSVLARYPELGRLIS